MKIVIINVIIFVLLFNLPLLAESNLSSCVANIASFTPYDFTPEDHLYEVKSDSSYTWDKENPVVVFPINLRASWLPLIAANNGFGPNENSVFFRNYGFKLDIKLIENPSEACQAFVSGEAHILAGSFDVIAFSADKLFLDPRTHPRVYQVISWSSGIDCLITRTPISSFDELDNSSIVYSPNSASQYYLCHLINTLASGSAIQFNHVHSSSNTDSIKKFINDTSIDACVVWLSDLQSLARVMPDAYLFSTTAENPRIIADTWAARADFAKDNPEIIKGLIQTIFESISLLEKEDLKTKALQWMADGYGLEVEEIQKMEQGLTFLDYNENINFFVNSQNPNNFENLWNKTNELYHCFDVIDSMTDFRLLSDFRPLLELGKKETETLGSVLDNTNTENHQIEELLDD